MSKWGNCQVLRKLSEFYPDLSEIHLLISEEVRIWRKLSDLEWWFEIAKIICLQLKHLFYNLFHFDYFEWACYLSKIHADSTKS